MTGAVRCLSRTLLQVSRSTTTKRKPGRSGRQWPITQCRSFSSVPWRLAEENASGSTTENATTDNNKSAGSMLTIEDLDPETKAEFDRSSPEDQQEMRDALRHLSESDPSEAFINAEIDEEIAQEVDAIEREEPMVFPEHKPNKNNAGFWADEEDDEFGQVFDEDDDFQADDITTPAHAQLDLHRDMREYQRRIAWDMPLLRSTFRTYIPVTPLSPPKN